MPPFRSGLQQRAEQRMAAAELATKLRLEHALRAPVGLPHCQVTLMSKRHINYTN